MMNRGDLIQGLYGSYIKPFFAKGTGNEPFTHHFGADFSQVS